MNFSGENDFMLILHNCQQRAVEKINNWLSLLPEEYQNDVYGVPWSIISLTAALGVVLIWVVIWRSSVSKQIQREKHLYTASEELRGQLQEIIKQKIDTENELKDMQSKVKEINYNFEEERASRTKIEEEHQHLEERVQNLQDENQTKSLQLDEYNNTLKGIEKEKNNFINKTKQFEKLLEEQKQTNNDLETQITNATNELKETKSSRKDLEDRLKDYEKRLNKKEKSEEKLDKKLKDWEEQGKNLKHQVKKLEEKVGSVNDENKTQKQEIDVLKDCLMQLQGVRDALAESGDEDVESEELIEKQKEKLKSLIDVAWMQKKVKQTEVEKGRVMIELQSEKKSREETEARIGELEAEKENERGLHQKTERELQVQQAKLNVIQEFYAKREVEMQGKLGKEVTVREMNESRLAEESDRISQLVEQVEVYKKMNEDSKRQIAENDKQRKHEVGLFEKKAHSNWLSTKDAERKYDEAQREMTQLRMELQELERRLRDAETREPIVLRPRPLPASGPFGPPFRDMSPPVRMGGRRSPVGSIHSEGGPADRPHRPPSHGHPPGEPIEGGEGPPSRGPFRRGSHPIKDSPRRDGPSPYLHDPMYDGPTPIRAPFMPRGGGPPFRPMRDVPPLFMPDDLPMMDGGPPMRDRPPFRDGPPPPPMESRPPPVQPGPPPGSDRPPSGPHLSMFGGPPPQNSLPPRAPRPGSHGPMNSSAYMDRPGPPRQDQLSRPPMMPLHGNHPYSNATQNEYDIHSPHGAV